MNSPQIDLRAIIKQEGLRYTQQREAVWLELQSSDSHRDAENIYFALRQKSINISRATVYRTIEILVKNNLVRKLDLGDGKNRYESKWGLTHHDHLICTKCGRIEEFFHEGIEEMQKEIAAQYNFTLTNHVHQLIGLCENCRADEA
ncbi:MAG: transcriptional repressor [Candidatus Marinimicrobia bacterium]|nr:transcriptional repressor [Candidatus Neomarinimicrobiota bacterium]